MRPSSISYLSKKPLAALFILLLFLVDGGSMWAQLPTTAFRSRHPTLVNSRDSSRRSLFEPPEICGTIFVVDSVELNGQGTKELVIYRNCLRQLELHGGSFDISERELTGHYEIWDRDSGSLLFSAMDCLEFNYTRFDIYSEPMLAQGSGGYHYEVVLNKTGWLHIRNTRGSARPDHPEGRYRFTAEGFRLVPGAR